MKFSLLVLIALLFGGCVIKPTTSSMFESDIQREQLLRISKNYEGLISELRQKVNDKNLVEDRIKLAGLYLEINDINNANYYIEPALSSKNAAAFLTKGAILERENKLDEALTFLENGLLLDPKSADIWNLKGIIYSKQKEYQNAKMSFHKAKELFGNEHKIDANLGILELIQGNYSASLSYFKPLYLREYKDNHFLNAFVYSLVKNGEKELARQIAREEGISDDFTIIENAALNSRLYQANSDENKIQK
ncbi:MAG: hypothetical protein LUC34_01580 [Campylobacter sp.]|nr:hypothetical protein [Campylobacter sp.]